MRILCSTTPMEGVFGPFVPLGRALAAGGHEVVVATGPDLRARVSRRGFACEVAGPAAMEGAMAAMADPAVRAAGPGERWRFPAAMFGDVIVAGKLAALREIADRGEPDLVIHPSVDLSGPLVAAERGLPSACYGFLSPLEPDVLAGLAERVAPHWERAGLEPDADAGIYRGRYLDPCPPSLAAAAGGPRPAGQPIRSEIPGDSAAALPAWAATLGGRPTVYVSLGTVPLFNQPSRFRALLEALVEEDVDVVATVSRLYDPAALGELADSVHVEQWLSLAALLPRCDAVLCHAGSGTALAALRAGLPMVLVPDGADQFVNAALCADAGVARSLLPEAATPEALRAAVSGVLAPGSPERRGGAAARGRDRLDAGGRCGRAGGRGGGRGARRRARSVGRQVGVVVFHAWPKSIVL